VGGAFRALAYALELGERIAAELAEEKAVALEQAELLDLRGEGVDHPNGDECR
jgi:hypothetical protein